MAETFKVLEKYCIRITITQKQTHFCMGDMMALSNSETKTMLNGLWLTKKYI